ncbi:hypothetical protein D5086_021983 [Populus alba]|uniref:Uncharacterized protein n=1 Tax=Populus alba TaxID=43335 RepID=A0ACC4BEF7_POPAL
MEMEDWIESMRGGELVVIDEGGRSTVSQGQRGDLSDTENLTESITVEGYMLINQGRVSSEGQETYVSNVGVEDLTDDFIMVADESGVSEGLDTHKAKGEALLTTELQECPSAPVCVSGGFVLLVGEEGRQLNHIHGLERFEKQPSSLPLNDHQKPKELKFGEKVQIKLGRDACSVKEIKAILKDNRPSVEKEQSLRRN